MSEALDDPPRLYGDQHLTLLHSDADAAYIQKHVLPHFSGRDLEVRPHVSGTEIGLEVEACVVTCLDDDALSSLLHEASERDYWLGVLPHRGLRHGAAMLGVPAEMAEAMAGAYAHARAELARSLAGVAIAVALVPPLAVVGIGLAWGDFSVFRGSSLLFLTNLAGIVLAAALTFLVLGFSPFRRARRGLAVSLASVATVSIPLALGFSAMADERHIVHTLEGWKVQGATLRHVDVRRGDPTHLSLQLVSSKPMDVSADRRNQAVHRGTHRARGAPRGDRRRSAMITVRAPEFPLDGTAAVHMSRG